MATTAKTIAAKNAIPDAGGLDCMRLSSAVAHWIQEPDAVPDAGVLA
jgi:hypothetical protein